MNSIGAIQRAELFAAVERLIDEQIKTSASIKTVIEGCLILVETDTVLGDRIDQITKRVDVAHDRLDIVNKRLRMLEEAK